MLVISTTVLLAALGVLGLVVGSFLNVVIARVPAGESIVWPGSRCPRCGHALAWYENVPLVSWLVLRGRCRACGQPISIRYPAVELLTAALFLACAFVFGPGWMLVRALLLTGFLLPLAFIDLEHWVVPVEIAGLGAASGVLSAIPLGRATFIACVIGAAAAFLLFWAFESLSLLLVVRVIRPAMRALQRLAARLRSVEPPAPEPDPTEAFGAGDKWILLLVGSFLGWQSLFGVLLLSAVQGSLVGAVLLLVQGRAGPEAPPPGSPATEDGWVPDRTALPYGPWLVLAALEILLLGPWLAETFPSPLTALLTGQQWFPP
jgi:leader peptidase (prepilin peptidase) / N-methyltransferase